MNLSNTETVAHKTDSLFEIVSGKPSRISEKFYNFINFYTVLKSYRIPVIEAQNYLQKSQNTQQ